VIVPEIVIEPVTASAALLVASAFVSAASSPDPAQAPSDAHTTSRSAGRPHKAGATSVWISSFMVSPRSM
jgi:hypothetical protein